MWLTTAQLREESEFTNRGSRLYLRGVTDGQKIFLVEYLFTMVSSFDVLLCTLVYRNMYNQVRGEVKIFLKKNQNF